MERGSAISPALKKKLQKLDHDKVVKNLKRNGIDVVEYDKGNTVYQYILHPKDTQKGAGIFIWKLIDFLVNHQDFVILPKADFEAKKAEAKVFKRMRA